MQIKAIWCNQIKTQNLTLLKDSPFWGDCKKVTFRTWSCGSNCCCCGCFCCCWYLFYFTPSLSANTIWACYFYGLTNLEENAHWNRFAESEPSAAKSRLTQKVAWYLWWGFLYVVNYSCAFTIYLWHKLSRNFKYLFDDE